MMIAVVVVVVVIVNKLRTEQLKTKQHLQQRNDKTTNYNYLINYDNR